MQHWLGMLLLFVLDGFVSAGGGYVFQYFAMTKTAEASIHLLGFGGELECRRWLAHLTCSFGTVLL